MMMLLFALVVSTSAVAVQGVDICAQDVLRTPGRITSPDYGSNPHYPPNKRCVLTLAAPNSERVGLTFHDFDLEASLGCQYDSLQVRNGDEKAPAFGVYCGDEIPRDLLSTGENMTLVFNSDHMITGRGFVAEWWMTKATSLCNTDELQCRNRKCVSVTRKCDGTDDCEDGTDEENCGHPVTTPGSCGVPEISPDLSDGEDRILGGREVVPGSWPWQADLQIKPYEPNGHICGGTLITSQWVMTASHCFINYPNRTRWRVHLGNHRLYKKDSSEQVRYMEKLIVYPGIPEEEFVQLRQFDANHDITLVKLSAPVALTDNVRVACLPKKSETVPIGKKCYVTGWGETRGTGNSGVLKQMRSPILPGDSCLNPFVSFNSDTMICTGDLNGTNGACIGDSGGPLVCEDDGRWTVHGVASYVTEMNLQKAICSQKDRPTAYTKVSSNIDWIWETIKKYG